MSRFSLRLSDISETSHRSGILTLNDRHILRQVILAETLNMRDRLIIDRLLQTIRQGSIRLDA